MRLLIGAAAVGLLGLAGLRSTPAVPANPGHVQVSVNAICGENSVQFSASPWTAPVARGDTVVWVLDNLSNVDAITVNAVKPNAWPYRETSLRGTKKVPARARDMKASAQSGVRYRYNVQFICVIAQKVDTVVIDPDMIIQ